LNPPPPCERGATAQSAATVFVSIPIPVFAAPAYVSADAHVTAFSRIPCALARIFRSSLQSLSVQPPQAAGLVCGEAIQSRVFGRSINRAKP